jgi:hypothetical protein
VRPIEEHPHFTDGEIEAQKHYKKEVPMLHAPQRARSHWRSSSCSDPRVTTDPLGSGSVCPADERVLSQDSKKLDLEWGEDRAVPHTFLSTHSVLSTKERQGTKGTQPLPSANPSLVRSS